MLHLLNLPWKYFSLEIKESEKSQQYSRDKVILNFWQYGKILGYQKRLFPLKYRLKMKDLDVHSMLVSVEACFWNLLKSTWHPFRLVLFPRSFHWVAHDTLFTCCIIITFLVWTDASLVTAGNTFSFTEESSKPRVSQLSLISYSVKAPLIS